VRVIASPSPIHSGSFRNAIDFRCVYVTSLDLTTSHPLGHSRVHYKLDGVKEQDWECDKGKLATSRHGGHRRQYKTNGKRFLTPGKHRGNPIFTNQAKPSTTIIRDDHGDRVQTGTLNDQTSKVPCRRKTALPLKTSSCFDGRLGNDQQHEALSDNSQTEFMIRCESTDRNDQAGQLAEKRRQENNDDQIANDRRSIDVRCG
jgi:hypothetical protein